MKSLYVIGDIHGMLNKLETLLAKISNHMKTHPADQVELIFVGDYVDRGPDSKGVLQLVKFLTETPAPFSKVVAITGNHEVMMINAEDNWQDQRLWLMNGGNETLESFGDSSNHPQTISQLVGPSLMKWIRELPVYYEVGKIAVSHAGIDDEEFKAGEQSKEDLIWSRKLRMHAHKIYDYTIHGHTPMKAALVETHVAYIDTGAVFGGPLTALYIPDVENPLEGKELIQSNE